MCQLLGMNCNVPTDICFSFTGFQARGGATDVHSDGWGIAFFEGKGTRLFLDPQPSCTSPVAELVRHYPIRSKNVISHIRKATQGAIGLENTHPFMRELWGRYWIFAHNGNLLDFTPNLDGSFLPVGLTDSERAFCWLLQELRQRFGSTAPAHTALFDAVHALTLEIAGHGEFNFLLSNGDWLFAHASTKLSYIIRQAPFTQAHLMDHDVTVDFSNVTTPEDRVAVIATLPLTDNEAWIEMPAGTLWWFEEGTATKTLATRPGPSKKTA
ncbi:class II glutamine amidotransferase [Dechloromonas denitrificans]|uniref:class II glutamine amidotransferase n=1 Tax=Dechloromonas denitrificans TaxID=281362 RepID=UPI001CF812B9|nr:class II glutamine amidotransferase [Dechloromonas denitrificans]UCV04472.1 class II glutamine amidotransferase [Dechloromonas denitrificans]